MAEPTLIVIQDTISAACHIDQKPMTIILSGDFNRHHLMWAAYLKAQQPFSPLITQEKALPLTRLCWTDQTYSSDAIFTTIIIAQTTG
ncbi:hypothetical protein IFM47457_11207 [Aspergillus lentulus]|nr:hypothetical protein IFM47457_11207 [Aspergillus lentulus]